jgi:hypothetical protein
MAVMVIDVVNAVEFAEETVKVRGGGELPPLRKKMSETFG